MASVKCLRRKTRNKIEKECDQICTHSMGVDHGGQGDKSRPRIWSGRTLMQIVPQILPYRYKNEHSVAFKVCQNPFSAGARPRTPLGELKTLLRPRSLLRKGHPPHTPPHAAPTHLRRSPCVPPKFQPDLRLWWDYLYSSASNAKKSVFN